MGWECTAVAGVGPVCRRKLLLHHPQRGPRPCRASNELKRVTLDSVYGAKAFWLTLQALDDAWKAAIAWHSFSLLCCSLSDYCSIFFYKYCSNTFAPR